MGDENEIQPEPNDTAIDVLCVGTADAISGHHVSDFARIAGPHRASPKLKIQF